jgi:hypothetical protein
MLRLFLLSWSLFFFMYAQSFFVTSVLGIGVAPTIAASFSLGVTGAMNFEFAAFFAIITPLLLFQTTLENSRVNLELQSGNPMS